MLERIESNLTRQERALEYLLSLLEEEFSQLGGRDPQAVVGTEFSIQELLRQLAVERVELKSLVARANPQASNLPEFIRSLDGEDADRLGEVFLRADGVEQRVAVQAERNAELAMALMDQGRLMLEFLQGKIQPKSENTYSHAGRYSACRPGASIMSGRT
jgi:hypothetical protein